MDHDNKGNEPRLLSEAEREHAIEKLHDIPNVLPPRGLETLANKSFLFIRVVSRESSQGRQLIRVLMLSRRNIFISTEKGETRRIISVLQIRKLMKGDLVGNPQILFQLPDYDLLVTFIRDWRNLNTFTVERFIQLLSLITEATKGCTLPVAEHTGRLTPFARLRSRGDSKSKGVGGKIKNFFSRLFGKKKRHLLDDESNSYESDSYDDILSRMHHREALDDERQQLSSDAIENENRRLRQLERSALLNDEDIMSAIRREARLLARLRQELQEMTHEINEFVESVVENEDPDDPLIQLQMANSVRERAGTTLPSGLRSTPRGFSNANKNEYHTDFETPANAHDQSRAYGIDLALERSRLERIVTEIGKLEDQNQQIRISIKHCQDIVAIASSRPGGNDPSFREVSEGMSPKVSQNKRARAANFTVWGHDPERWGLHGNGLGDQSVPLISLRSGVFGKAESASAAAIGGSESILDDEDTRHHREDYEESMEDFQDEVSYTSRTDATTSSDGALDEADLLGSLSQISPRDLENLGFDLTPGLQPSLLSYDITHVESSGGPWTELGHNRSPGRKRNRSPRLTKLANRREKCLRTLVYLIHEICASQRELITQQILSQ